MAQVPATGADTLHVAAGVYGAALGETFNWRVRPRLSFAGAGPGAAIVDGGGAFQLFVYESASFSEGWSTLPDTVLEGLTLQSAGVGIYIYSDGGAAQPALRDLEITGTSVGISGNDDFYGGASYVDGTRLRLHGNGRGLSTDAFGVLVDCDFSSNQVGALVASNGITKVTLRRCTLTGNAEGVIVTGSNGGAVATLEDCLVAGNTGNGVFSQDDPTFYGTTSADLYRCTVVDNGLAGLFAQDTWGNAFGYAESSILYGNGDGVAGQVGAAWCDIGDGDFSGTSGNFSADPLFRDAPNGDYRLAWGSPCAETANPANPPAALDLDGLPRSADGDRRKIPNATFLLGQTFAWQGLVDSVAAPAGKAYSNAVEVTIVP